MIRFSPLYLIIAGLVCLAMVILSIGIGAGQPYFSDSIQLISLSLVHWDTSYLTPLWEIRIPRTIAIVLVGLALAVSGVLLQSLLKNPLADSGLIGINSGASLAIVVALIFQFHQFSLFVWALIGAMLSAVLVYLLNPKSQVNEATYTRLILAGLAITSTFHGVMAALLLRYQDGLEQFRFWVLGSFNRVDEQQLFISFFLISLGFVITAFILRPLALSLVGQQLAMGLGLNVKRLEFFCLCAIVLLTGTSVALTGPIAFLGLIAPYFARAIGAIELKQQILVSAFFGVILLLTADILARVLVQPFETPVSVLLALLGAPLLIWMVRQSHLQSIVQVER